MHQWLFSFSKILWVAGLAVGTVCIQAQSIYRCGDGQKTYSDRPCVDGKALPKTATTPTEAERAEAQKIADRERTLANDLEQKRLSQERTAKSGVIGMDTRLRVTRSAPANPIRVKSSNPKRLKLHASPSASKPSR
jgi:hypothetical protein